MTKTKTATHLQIFYNKFNQNNQNLKNSADLSMLIHKPQAIFNLKRQVIEGVSLKETSEEVYVGILT